MKIDPKMIEFFEGLTAVDDSGMVFGNRPNENRLNIKNELAAVRENPLVPFLNLIATEESGLFRTEVVRQHEAYGNFVLSYERFLKFISLSARFNRSIKYKVKYREKLTTKEKRLKEEYIAATKFHELDFYNCLIHARILLDKTAALSRHFLTENEKPSFNSFSDQKKFFQRRKVPYGNCEEYAHYVRTQTDWFDFPLKRVRDKFIIHNSPKHMQFFGFPSTSYNDLCLTYFVPVNDRGDLGGVRVVTVSVITLAKDIHTFLNWFCNYAQSRMHTIKKS